MSEQFDKLEREIEREMALLGRFPHPRANSACIGRIKQAIGYVNGHSRTRRLSLWRLPGRIAVAAAVLLALGTAWKSGQAPVLTGELSGVVSAADEPRQDAATALADWADAVDASTQTVRAIVQYGWLVDDDSPADSAAEVDDFIESLDTVLRSGA